METERVRIDEAKRRLKEEEEKGKERFQRLLRKGRRKRKRKGRGG